MDTNDRADLPDDGQDDRADEGTDVDVPSATIIGANTAAANAGPYPGGIVAPAAETAAAEAEGEDLAPLNLDALDQFAKKDRSTEAEGADESVSNRQSELESDELNG